MKSHRPLSPDTDLVRNHHRVPWILREAARVRRELANGTRQPSLVDRVVAWWRVVRVAPVVPIATRRP